MNRIKTKADNGMLVDFALTDIDTIETSLVKGAALCIKLKGLGSIPVHPASIGDTFAQLQRLSV